eukprot:gene11390-8106_t
MYDPRNPSELDCEEGDVAEVPDDEFIEEWVGANPPDNANIIYRQAYQTWAKKREEFEDGRRVFTANIDLALSQASRTHIRAHHNEEWNTAMLLEDPFRALEIIRQSHAVMGGATATLNDFEHARKGITEASQGSTESLADFKERFIRLVTHARTVGVNETRLSRIETVYHFIRGVTEKKSLFIKQDLVNRHTLDPVNVPQTIEVAHGLIAASVRALADIEGEEPRTAIAKLATTESKHKTKCWHCDREGHTAENCRVLKRIIQEHRRSSPARKTTSKDSPANRKRVKFATPDPRPRRETRPRNAVERYPRDTKRRRDDDDSDNHSNASDEDKFMYGSKSTRKYKKPKTAMITIANAIASTPQTPIIILDTGANCHIVNNIAALTNVTHTNSIAIKGVGVHDTHATQEGDAGPFGKALLVASSQYCILAFGQLATMYDMSYDKHDDTFEVHDASGTLLARFTRSNEDLYVLDGTESQEVSNFIAQLTVAPQRPNVAAAARKILTRNDRDRAEKAKDLHIALGHPHDEALIALLRMNGIRDCFLQPQDVRNARHIYGPCAECAKGKAIIPRAPKKASSSPPPYVGHTYHADIMFIGSQPHLRICEGSSKYGTLIPLEKKDSHSLLDKLKVYFGRMKALTQSEPRILRTDNEVTFTAIADHLAALGVLLQQSPSGNHSATIERQIRTDRDAYRTMAESLPYKIPGNLASLAMQDVVRVRNLVPNSATNGICPAEIITGRKPTMDDVALPWGSIVYATDPSSNKDKHLPRADLGIILSHNIESKSGSVDILILEHGRPRTVNRPTRLVRRCKTASDITKAITELATLATKSPTIDDNTIINPSLDRSTTKPSTSPTETATEPATSIAKTTDPPPPPRASDATLNPTRANGPTVDNRQPPPQTPAPPGGQPPVQAPTPEVPAAAHPVANPRRQLRDRTQLRPPRRYALNLTVRKAIDSYGEDARTAIAAEFQSLLDKKVWTPIKHIDQAQTSKHARVLPCSMFLKAKHLPDGKFDKLKARLVAGGHLTDKSLYNFDECAADTVKTETLMTTLAIAAHDSMHIETMDFPTAYLNGKLKDTQVMRIDRFLASILTGIDNSYRQFLQRNGTILVNLHGALYGLPEAGKIWFNKLKSSLLRIGLKQSPEDPCLFNIREGKHSSTMVLHVDDILHTYSDTRQTNSQRPYLLTKPLAGQLFRRFRDHLLNGSTAEERPFPLHNDSRYGKPPLEPKECVGQPKPPSSKLLKRSAK